MAQDNRYKTILLFGAPGAGKGTQGNILGRVPGFFHMSCGEVFRNIDINSDLGKVFYEHSSRGELVPDEITVKMWAKNIAARVTLGIYKPNDDLLILDGIPRTVEQAGLMDQHIHVYKVIHLTCSDEEAMFQRLRRRALKENRIDDADEGVIRKRWEVYKRETEPVLDHYPKEDIIEIDSIGSPANILHDVLEVVTPIQNAHFTAFSG
jgi:adenylate kinase